MHPPPKPDLDLYTHLTTLLHPSPPTTLELDILPLSLCPHIQHCPTAIAIPKPLLLSAYLVAREIFFSPAPSTTAPTPDPDPEPPHPAISPSASSTAAETAEATTQSHYRATTLLLLQTPSHTTALNARKRHLLHLLHHHHPASPPSPSPIHHELHLLASLLTSPLPQHAKSAPLWAHRLWLVRTFPAQVLALPRCGAPDVEEEDEDKDEEGGSWGGFWREEMERVVMRAGEGGANYWAWGYGREVYRVVASRCPQDGHGRRERVKGEREVLAAVEKWCLLHPRDISGWAFLVFLLREMAGGGLEAGRVRREVREWVQRFAWRGGSVGWFLGAVREVEGPGTGLEELLDEGGD